MSLPELLGYAIVSLPFWERDQLTGSDKGKKYLRGKLDNRSIDLELDDTPCPAPKEQPTAPQPASRQLMMSADGYFCYRDTL